MTNEEAKLLVNYNLKELRKNNPSFLTKFLVTEGALNVLVSPADLFLLLDKNAATPFSIVMHGLACSIGLMISTGAIFPNCWENNSKEVERIDLLKKLRTELKNGINRFEKISMDDFNKFIELIEEESMITGEFVTRKKGPETRYSGPYGSYLEVDKNGIIKKCKLLGFWMSPSELEQSQQFEGKHISEFQYFLNNLIPSYTDYNRDSFNKIANRYVSSKTRVLKKSTSN